MTDEQKANLAKARQAAALAKREKQEEQAAKSLEGRFESFAAKTEENIENLSTTVEKLTELVKAVVDASDHRPAQSSPAHDNIPPSVRRHAEDDQDYEAGYFPPRYRKIIDQKLGPDFKASLEEAGGADCILKVVVPPQWDCRVGDEKLISTADIRTWKIRRSSDMADIETACTKFGDIILKKYRDFKPPVTKE